jgi:hypothetical protein
MTCKGRVEYNTYANPGWMQIEGDACDFNEKSAAGRKILTSCPVMQLCEVKAYVESGQTITIEQARYARCEGAPSDALYRTAMNLGRINR